MIRTKTLIVFSILATSQLIWASKAEAGPLLDWLFNRNRCCQNRVFRPAVPVQNCGTCTTTCQQTCQRVVVNYVPYTAYRTSWERVPVTTYRQTTSTDPCTGCTVTCNRPCTTYSWRMKQEPFTTYRPVYRTETYQVPVTYTTPAPAIQAAPACNTCAMPAIQTTPVSTPYYQTTPAATGVTYEPTPATGSTVPAEQRPSLNLQDLQNSGNDGSTSRTYWPTQINSQPATTTNYSPVRDPNPSDRWNNNSAPQLLNQSAAAPSVERWSYSPVKLASYNAPLKTPVALMTSESTEYVGSVSVGRQTESRWQTAPQQRRHQGRLNDGWRND